jgi:hypothetical protein
LVLNSKTVQTVLFVEDLLLVVEDRLRVQGLLQGQVVMDCLLGHQDFDLDPAPVSQLPGLVAPLVLVVLVGRRPALVAEEPG